jgi:hypothetical protein
MSQEKPLFAKLHYELLELGLPMKLVGLYGILEHMAGSKGECWPKHSTLAAKCGLKSRRHVVRLLEALHRLKLIEWKRGQYHNRYRVLVPDVTFLSHLSGHGCHISDVTRASHRKESVRKEPLKRATRQSVGQSTSGSVGKAPETDGLTELLTQAWPKTPGHPGAKLVAEIAAILTAADIPLAEFRAFLASRRAKATSFGLALPLARELRDRRNGDNARRSQSAADKHSHEIERVKKILRDPKLSAEERAGYQRYLDALRREPKSETTRVQKGAA